MAMHNAFQVSGGAAGETSGELTDVVHGATPWAMVSMVVLASVIVSAFWSSVAHSSLVVWWALTVLVALLRWLGAALYRRSTASSRRAGRWYWMVVVGALVSAALWAATPWWIWPESANYQALLVIVIAGVVSSAAISLAPLLGAIIPFALVSGIPFVFHYATQGSEVGIATSLVLMFFLTMVSVSAWRMNRLLRSNLVAKQGHQNPVTELQHEALHDPLTNLANRRFFLERLKQEFSRARRHNRTGALLFLDLDNFKPINDSLGHYVGDQLLQKLAKRLRERFRDEDVAGRLGGDEFVVLLADIGSEPVSVIYKVEHVASQLKELLTEPYLIDDHEVSVSVSIGIALFPEDADSYQDTLKHADTTMYRAKAQGRNNYQFFCIDMQEEARQRLALEKDLRLALREDTLALHYQRLVNAEGDVLGLEALARWRHPDRGDIPPDVFVPVAEESMLVHELHQWVVRRACEDLRRMIDTWGIDRVPLVSINVSARTFHHADFEQQLLEQVARADIPPQRLCLEITENSLMERVDSVMDKMRALRGSGILFSIDHFGTGYSSLFYLKRLPVDSRHIHAPSGLTFQFLALEPLTTRHRSRWPVPTTSDTP